MCAYELDIPVTMVTVKGSNSVVEANNTPTGGSVSSEACCQVIIFTVTFNEEMIFRNDITTFSCTSLRKFNK